MARVAKQNVREKILEAAERRLWHYGIKKTTIDEIAADAGVGKGTVYLYFESKEDISLAIFVSYKQGILRHQEEIVCDPNLETFSKIREFLLYPVMTAQTKCQQYPEALEIITVLKPHLADHLRPYLDQEIKLLARALSEGIDQGLLNIEDPLSAARSLKLMTMGFFPPYPCVREIDEIEREIDSILGLVARGLRCSQYSPGTLDKENLLR